ncbi:hypothetical protein A9Q74_16485 [Colwellia sp. 39_35_sub15_T18]|nr:hypothetical protein A9Q74_16485 [Colwellia sp. 39_35_sub15_T18]
MYFVGPLFGWIMWLLTRKRSQRRAMEDFVQDLFGWFPNFVGDVFSFLLVNDIAVIIYILTAGIFGLCVDEALR